MPQTGSEPSAPWWRHGHVWLLVAGPAVVVVAGIATFVIAVRSPDPVLAEDYYRRGVELSRSGAAADRHLLPAQQGRNHAATPVRP